MYMGTDIMLIREARVNGKWLCCEQSYAEWLKKENITPMFSDRIRDESSAISEVYGYSQVYGILTGNRYLTSDQFFDYPNGLPEDMSKPLSMRIEDERECFKKCYKDLSPEDIERNLKGKFYNTTFHDLEMYLGKWRIDMEETGTYPTDFATDECVEKLDRLSTGIYKKDTAKQIEVMKKIFDDPEYNPLRWFMNQLNDTPCNGEFNGNLRDIDDKDKRLVFWYSY